MTTLIQTGGALGERRCDAKCYDAECLECDCICGGDNHGKGLDAALESMRNVAKDEYFEKIKAAGGIVPDWVMQRPLL